MNRLFTVCLFCSASDGLPAGAQDLARAFGEACARAGYRLVYGGGTRGLMGIASRAALASGGMALGIIPGGLVKRERAGGEQVGSIEVVKSLAERKERMGALSDAFVALPGGVGTMDELFEVLTWNDLAMQDKPVILCHSDGYWDGVIEWFERATRDGAVRPRARRRLHFANGLEQALQILRDAASAVALTTRVD